MDQRWSMSISPRKPSPGASGKGQEPTIKADEEIPSLRFKAGMTGPPGAKQVGERSATSMRVEREIRVFLKVLRVAISSPVNLITCAIVAAIFVMIATAPKPSMVIIGDKPREALVAAAILFMPLFGLYLLIRLAVAIFGKWRDALFFACALWALLMPIVIGVIAGTRYGYGDDDAKHALVAKLYDLDMKRSTFEHLPRLIDLGESCYPDYRGQHCWIVVVKPQSEDDLDIAQDVGNWHSIKSNTVLGLMPAYVKYGKVDVRRMSESAYSVLSQDYAGQ
jgi:hypothetical protein